MSQPFDIERTARGIASRLMLSGETVTGAKLADEFGLAGSEQVRECVNWLRKQGDPSISRIASDETGYTWAIRYEQAQATVHHLKGRAFSILGAASGLAKSFGRTGIEQEELSL